MWGDTLTGCTDEGLSMTRLALLSFVLMLAAVTAVHSDLPRLAERGHISDIESVQPELARLQGEWVGTSDLILVVENNQCAFPFFCCCGRRSESRGLAVRLTNGSKTILMDGYTPIPYTWSGNLLTMRVNISELGRSDEKPSEPHYMLLTFRRVKPE
jgi:hypothetical protein